MSILCLSEGGCIDDDDDDDVADVCEGEHKAMWFEPPGHSCEGIWEGEDEGVCVCVCVCVCV